jgi:hypothetical protein
MMRRFYFGKGQLVLYNENRNSRVYADSLFVILPMHLISHADGERDI